MLGTKTSEPKVHGNAKKARQAFEQGDRYFACIIGPSNAAEIGTVEDEGWEFVQMVYEPSGHGEWISTPHCLFRRRR